MSSEQQLDKEEIKRLCSGRWSDIVMVLAPTLSMPLTKLSKAQPCPKCGGTDRFNFDKEFETTGAAWCRQCDLKCPDGIELLARFNGWDFKYVLSELALYLGIKKETGNRQEVTPKPTPETVKPDDLISKKKNLVKLYKNCVDDSPRLRSYLDSRGLPQATPSDLLYHPGLYHRLSDGTVCHEDAMVAVVRNIDASVITAQRIYLDNASTGKSIKQPNKMIMPTVGELKGCAVRLAYPEEDLCITEGIETALAVRAMTKDMPTWATVSSELMKTVEIPDHVKNVYIYADHDQPGIEAAEILATRLTDNGVKCFIYIPENEGDDWLDEYVRCGQEVITRLTSVQMYKTKDLMQQENIVNPRGFMTFQALDIPVPKPIINGIVNEQEIIVLSGPAKLGKSILAANLAFHASLGMNWFGFEVPRPVKVLYLQREVGDGWMQQRSRKMCEGFLNKQYMTELYLKNMLEPPGDLNADLLEHNLFIPEPVNFKIDDDEAWLMLTAQVAREQYDLVIIDPLFCMIQGNENDTKDMTKVMDNLIAFKNATLCSILLIHHFGKSTGEHKGANAHRGSSVVGGASDGNITFKAFDDAELIASNGLSGEVDEFAVIDFEMRNDAKRESMIMWRNPDYLIWERAKSGGIDRKKSRGGSGTPVIEILNEVGKSIPLSELAVLMVDRGWSSEATARRAVAKLIDSGGLIAMRAEGKHATKKDIFLPQWIGSTGL